LKNKQAMSLSDQRLPEDPLHAELALWVQGRVVAQTSVFGGLNQLSIEARELGVAPVPRGQSLGTRLPVLNTMFGVRFILRIDVEFHL
jgi:hypothetical protein